MRRGRARWWTRIKALDDWSVGYDWTSHINELNAKHGLTGDAALAPPIPGWPPAWFNGDIEQLTPNNWVLVVSLNPALAAEGHYDGRRAPAAAWDFWREHNLDPGHWNARSGFFPRLVEVAATAFEMSSFELDRPSFATNRMLFLEFCPYASRSFMNGRWEDIQAIADSDVGFAINRQIRSIVFTHGQPKLILVNGRCAIYDVNDYQRPEWCEKPIDHPAAPGKTMNLWEGSVKPWQQTIPILGFDFLGRRQHPSRLSVNQEMDVLKERIRDLFSFDFEADGWT